MAEPECEEGNKHGCGAKDKLDPVRHHGCFGRRSLCALCAANGPGWRLRLASRCGGECSFCRMKACEKLGQIRARKDEERERESGRSERRAALLVVPPPSERGL
ncbi:hypothetical protein EYF80_059742 [Liparis tanakae]|uniref:Uncharacterized protein n=1 Tax=Liparis tanakae TaxID=230148 RepID=A0A4Z2EMW4_9TELE|nr:hypothetical protein EYF80_059742 [Liparis tanakae]